MAVRPGNIDNRERDQSLSTRETPETSPPKQDDPAAAERRARLEAARKLRPQGLHWAESWHRGRDAAIAAIERDGNASKAREIPAPAVIACGDCFRKGRDAAIQVIEGA
jgi:hypothetical protein